MIVADRLPAQWPTATSPFIPAGHWSYDVLRRLDATGLLPPGSDVARRSMAQEEIAALLELAAANDSLGAAASYLRKYREEFNRPRAGGATRSDASAIGSFNAARDQVRSGIGYDTVWSGARPVDDEDDGDLAARSAFASRHVAGAITAGSHGIDELQIVLATQAVGVWAGRREVGYANAHGGGLVLNVATLDGGGVFLARPWKIPVLGSLRFETHVSKIDNVLNVNGSEDRSEPWFWTARAAIAPHARFRMAINRAMMFGGEGNVPVTFSRVLKNLIGNSNSDDENSFANQVLSVDVRYRIAIGSVPITLYGEWGTEDAAGAWLKVPGMVAGMEVSALPHRDLLFALERTEFMPNRASNSLWYQNSWFRGSWADDGVALGHPLGGHGREWRVVAMGGAPARGLTAVASAYRRHRGTQNLYAPERAGRSGGAMLALNARLSAAVRLLLAGELEDGSAWTATRARAGLRFGF